MTKHPTHPLVAKAPVDPVHGLRTIPVARPRLPKLAALAPYIERIDDARWYSNFGPLCEEFEGRLAERFGLASGGICTIANATIGLTLALKAAGARPGTLCIVPSWTFSASVHAVAEAGLIPFLVDVDEEGLLTPQIAREAVRCAPAEVGAIMPVAYCGQPIAPGPWDALASETGLAVVLDAAPAFDAARPGQGLTTVSLHATKVLGVGEGGFVMSQDPERVAETRLRANFGFRGSRIAQATGTNAKLSEYAAALGLAGLDEWPARVAAFRAAALRYRETLANLPLSLPEGWGEAWQSTTCVVRLSDPDQLKPVLGALHEKGVETRAWWGRGMHTHPAFCNYPRLALPMTERLAETTLGLPFFIDMATEEIDAVCHALREGLARA